MYTINAFALLYVYGWGFALFVFVFKICFAHFRYKYSVLHFVGNFICDICKVAHINNAIVGILCGSRVNYSL